MSRRESAAAYTAEIKSIIRDVGLPSSLMELGVKASDLDQLVSDAAKRDTSSDQQSTCPVARGHRNSTQGAVRGGMQPVDGMRHSALL